VLEQPTSIDLFCGGGGYSLGAHAAGFPTKAAVDVDPDLTSAFETNFPDSKRLLLNLASCKTEAILKTCSTDRGIGVVKISLCLVGNFLGIRVSAAS